MCVQCLLCTQQFPFSHHLPVSRVVLTLLRTTNLTDWQQVIDVTCPRTNISETDAEIWTQVWLKTLAYSILFFHSFFLSVHLFFLLGWRLSEDFQLSTFINLHWRNEMVFFTTDDTCEWGWHGSEASDRQTWEKPGPSGQEGVRDQREDRSPILHPHASLITTSSTSHVEKGNTARVLTQTKHKWAKALEVSCPI